MNPSEIIRPHWGWRVLLWALIAIAFTAWSIQFSFQHGRLIGAAGCDDVGYFIDGLDRLDEFYVHGFKGVVRSYFTNPPHSPFSTTLAAASFGLFGIHDWAPYAGNVIIVFALIAFTEWLLAGAALWLRIAGLALVLMTPLTQKAVTEFRPDVAVAILTAMGVVMATRRSLLTSSIGYRLAVGAVFGLALLVKPTMCVLTLFMWGLSLSVALLCDWYVHRPPIRALMTAYGLTGLTTIAVASPYYLCNGKHVFEYIYKNIFGSEAATWQTKASLGEHLLFYLTGPGAVEMIDNSAWIIVAALLVGAVHLVARGEKATIVRAGALAFCMLGAYAVPTASLCKHGFYGLTLLNLALFAALLALRQICASGSSMRPAWRWATAVALLGPTTVVLWQYPHVPTWGTRGDDRIGSSQQVCDALLSAIVAQQSEVNPVVLTTAECQYANCLTLQWCTRKTGQHVRFKSPAMGSDLEAYRQAMRRSEIDFVICFSTEKPMMQFASERQASEILATARSLPNLIETQSFRAHNGVVYYLFRNTEPSFTGWRNLKGLGPIEGPFPQWNLPRVRWGLGNESQFRFMSKHGTVMRLSLSCRSDVANQTLTVLLDGKEIYREGLPIRSEFTSLEIPLPVTTAGEHDLTFQYGACNAISESRELAVLFERLQVLQGEKQRTAD